MIKVGAFVGSNLTRRCTAGAYSALLVLAGFVWAKWVCSQQQQHPSTEGEQQMAQLKNLYEGQLISAAEFKAARQKVLDRLLASPPTNETDVA
eukprot:COSAG05_NODE_9232_length_629_cov_6.379182_1_plen_92_part_01